MPRLRLCDRRFESLILCEAGLDVGVDKFEQSESDRTAFVYQRSVKCPSVRLQFYSSSKYSFSQYSSDFSSSIC